jgi:cytochrome P450 family 4
MSWPIFELGTDCIGGPVTCAIFQDKVREELDHIFQGSDHAPTMKELNMMKYLERVIKESLRLYPSVPFIARKLTEDVQIGNLELVSYGM